MDSTTVISYALEAMKYIFAGISGTALYNIVTARAQSRKTGSETKQIDQSIEQRGRAFELEQLQTVITNLNRENQRLRDERDHYQDRVIEVETEKDELRKIVDELQEALDRAQSELNHVQIELNKIREAHRRSDV